MSEDPERPQVARVAEIAARARLRPLEPDDPDDGTMGEYQRQGIDAVRAELWRRCIPSRFLAAHVDDLTPELQGPVREWGQQPHGRNLVLLGPVGTGKTHAAIAAARMRFDCGSEVRFLPIIELLDMLRPGGPDGALEALMSCELLIVDDLGLQRATDWTDERLDALLNRRWLEQLSTIVTTNLTPDTLLATVGERSYSRLRDGSVGITIAGEDRRKDHHA